MFIAEITLIQDRALHPASSPTALPKFAIVEPPRKSECGPTIKQQLTQAFWFANVLSGLFIASWTNNHPEEVWGIAFLNAHTPEPYNGRRIWFCFGAFQI